MRDLNDWNVWNESAEDIDRGEIPKFCSTKPLAGCGKTLSESFDRAQDERRGVDIIVVFRSTEDLEAFRTLFQRPASVVSHAVGTLSGL